MHKLLCLGLTTALAGCSLAPAYRQPVAPISASFPATQPASQVSADIGWREYFADPRLQAYIAAALANNRDLAQSVARVAQARAQYRIQDAERLPQLNVQAGASRTHQPLNALGMGSALPGGGQPDSPTTISFNQYSLGVQVPSFELDFWGRVRNLSEAQRHEYLATVEGERAFRLSLIGQVAATYLQIRAGEEQIVLAGRAVVSRQEGLDIARRRMDAGVTSTVDYDQARLLVTQVETELAELRRTTAQNENLLTVLIGGPVTEALPASRPLGEQGNLTAIEPGLPSSLLANRPDILQAEQQLRAANANIGAARAAFLPSISLTGLAGFTSPALDDLTNSGSRQYQVSGAALLPIFDWGRRNAQLRLSRARADELVAAYQRAAQGAFREVADALVGRQLYAEQIAAQASAVEAQRRLAQTARKRYDNGISIYLEVLDAERSLFAAEQQLLALRSAELQNGVSLYVALGGGLRERSPITAGGEPAASEGVFP